MLTVSPSHSVQPLDTVTVTGAAKGTVTVRDGQGRVYHEQPAGDGVSLRVGGALGTHVVSLADEKGVVIDTAVFRVHTQTGVEDEGGRFQTLLNLLHDTMYNDFHSGYKKALRIDGKFYRYYVSWIRDHVHTLKGMKYYDFEAAHMKSGIELYADSQREDGMIWDKCKEMAHSELQIYRDYEFADGDFVRPIPGNPTRRWMRIPVENDVEYLWIEGLYHTWKAVGDTAWMFKYLDNAVRAVRYSTRDEYRWSEKYGLLKRGYTIDSWDFQHAEDARRSGSVMRVVPGKTIFGVMFGDNTGMMQSCRYLAEMLRAADRDGEADEMAGLADTLKERLDKLAWNGRFYTHHVSEQPEVRRDVGNTDESAQVVQSNAYSANRGIDHEQAVAIVDTYRRLRTEMPESSAGEFYACWPPFEKGFGMSPGDYMNGGVTAICAGELAHAAMEHGREAYGVDVLDRLLGWVERLNGHLHCTLKGCRPAQPRAHFTSVDLRGLANIDWVGDRDDSLGWSGEGANDMRHIPTGPQTFNGIAVDVIDPAENDRKACIGLARSGGYLSEVTIPLGGKAASVYLMHALSGNASPVGWLTFRYEDGSHFTQYVNRGKEVESFFMPAPDHAFIGGNKGKSRPGNLRVAWQGPNGRFENVAMFLYGWTNPHPEKTLTEVHVTCAEHHAKWFIGGVTLSDRPVIFPGGPVSYGIPDSWGAAAVVYAVIEGVAGIVNDGVAFERVRLSPRWAAAGVESATATACYPSSGGYCRYRYRHSREEGVRIELAGNGASTDIRLLLPEGFEPTSVRVDGTAVDVRTEVMEASRYLVISVSGIGAHTITAN